MSKTTPEEAEKLAEKYGIKLLYVDDSDRLAALIDEVRGVDAEPVAKHVGIVSGILGDICTIQLNGYAVRKGDKLYTRPAPSQPVAPVELPVVMYWVDGSPLVKLSDAQAAIEAARKSV